MEIAKTPLQADFYLTGGTALAAFYLHHRYSDDLDLFTDDPQAVVRVPPVMRDLAQRCRATVSFTRTTGSFLECFLVSQAGERLEMDFALDSPYRLEPKVQHPELGVWTDTALDISCNKLSALYDRADPKDFVDIYFIHHELYPLNDLLPKAKQKHPGLDEYWLAQAFARVTTLTMLPRLIKPVTLAQLAEFFTSQITRLMQAG